MDNELIVVRQLPIIEDQLRTIHDTVQVRVEDVLAMECTEETYKEVKKARSELNAQYRALEERRKEVKAQVEAPYKKFEAVYKACAGDLFSAADKQLAAKIAAVENGLKQKKAEQVYAYFEEYRESLGIPTDMVAFGITVTMSASLRSLKAQAKDYLDRVRGDLDMIATQEYKDEILVEYRKHLNASQAITAVVNRHAAIERERRMREEMSAAVERKQEAAEVVREMVEAEQQPAPASEPVIMPPVVVERTDDAEPPKQYSTAFEVTASLEQLKVLKNLLNDGGYTYRQLTRKNSNDGGMFYE